MISYIFVLIMNPFKKKEVILDTNMHGEERAYVVSGQYEDLVPMDIFPVQSTVILILISAMNNPMTGTIRKG